MPHSKDIILLLSTSDCSIYMFQNIETKNPLEIKHNVNSIQNNDCKNFNIEKLFITLNLSPIALNLSPIALILSPIALILS